MANTHKPPATTRSNQDQSGAIGRNQAQGALPRHVTPVQETCLSSPDRPIPPPLGTAACSWSASPLSSRRRVTSTDSSFLTLPSIEPSVRPASRSPSTSTTRSAGRSSPSFSACPPFATLTIVPSLETSLPLKQKAFQRRHAACTYARTQWQRAASRVQLLR